MSLNRIHAEALRPIKNTVFVTELESGPARTAGGLILPDDDMTERGIRDRWARVYAVGPEVEDLKPGEWVLIKHGRWTFGIDLVLDGSSVRLWKVEYPDSTLLVSQDDPRSARRTTL